MYDDRGDLDPAVSWPEALAALGLVAAVLCGLGYIALALVGLV